MKKNQFESFYEEIMKQIPDVLLPKVLEFISFFQTSDVNLYREFDKNYSPVGVEFLIPLYAKRYDLDPEKDIQKIAYIFYNNAYNQGFSYHLTNSANLPSISELGLNPGAIGINTEEEKDLAKLRLMLSEEIFNKLEPSHNDLLCNRLFYSRKLNLSNTYGKKTEWLDFLSTNLKWDCYGR